jgi:hypothetical protein
MKSGITLLSVLMAMALFSCSGKQEQHGPAEPPVIQYKKEKDTTNLDKPPVINLSDTFMPNQWVLYIRDSAATGERIGIKLSAIYNKKLAAVIKQQKLVICGPRMAWYKTSSPPFFFEAGFPIKKKPGKLPKKMFVKNIGGDSAVIAHYFGPYSKTYYAYETLRDWMKEHGQKPSAPPYEAYIGESLDSNGNPVDPYKIQTDIVFPHN